MPSSYYEPDDSVLPPLTRAIVNSNRIRGSHLNPANLTPAAKTLDAITDAIRELETRVIALEAQP